MPASKVAHPVGQGCLGRIRSARAGLKPAECTVADFVLGNGDRVMHMSVSETARDVGVGEATVIRFCNDLTFRKREAALVWLPLELLSKVVPTGGFEPPTSAV